MLAQEIKIRGEPTADPQKCRFVLDGEVLSRASLTLDKLSKIRVRFIYSVVFEELEIS